MNSFFAYTDYPEKADWPSQVFARFEQVEEDPEDPTRDQLQFSAIDADWWDRLLRTRDPLTAFNDAPLSMISWRRGENHWIEPEEDSVESAHWVYIEFGDSGIFSVEQTLNLFTPPRKRLVQRMTLLDAPTLRQLTKLCAASMESQASVKEIKNALALKMAPHCVGVYDVGQGNCNALLAPDFRPLLYFDFGGGVAGNSKTFPLALQRFCFTSKPTIVLSHWDWDHWSSASRDLQALTQTWIVPQQRLGVIHAQMAAYIRLNGKLLVWPAGRRSVATQYIKVLKCTGKPRNHDGLAMLIPDPGGLRAPILLTGDAAYTSIPSALSSSFAAIVATHHGGKMSQVAVPTATAMGTERVAYSFGRGNSFGHAFAKTRSNHQSGGWTVSLDTAVNSTARPANVALGWSNLVAGPTPCRRFSDACQLNIKQT